jgi:hypothetical protein
MRTGGRGGSELVVVAVAPASTFADGVSSLNDTAPLQPPHASATTTARRTRPGKNFGEVGEARIPRKVHGRGAFVIIDGQRAVGRRKTGVVPRFRRDRRFGPHGLARGQRMEGDP